MSFTTKSLVLINVLASIANALPAKPSRASSKCGGQVIDGTGTFMQSQTFTFSGTTLPSGLIAMDDKLIGDQENGAPYNHIFQAENVFVQNGYLNIKVPGGQTPASATDQAISSGEVYTEVSDILYASVRTHAIFSTVPGTCQSSFFYASDTQETDIEFLSDPTSTGNTDGTADVHFTNQPTNGGGVTSAEAAAPANVGSTVHEYRTDWTANFTAFYIDGVLQQTFTTNVPSQAGPWLWNNWANGNTGWSAGPPAQDSLYKIQKIDMYYNTTTTTSECS